MTDSRPKEVAQAGDGLRHFLLTTQLLIDDVDIVIPVKDVGVYSRQRLE